MTSTTTAKLTFFVPPSDGARAYQHNTSLKAGERNYGTEEKEVTIENVRGKEDAATLDATGFQLFHRPAKHQAFTNDADIEREYYPESIELIKELTGASRVVLFDHSTCNSLYQLTRPS